MNVATLQCPQHAGDRFGHETVRSTHGLAALPLFTDSALIDLLDHFPRDRLFAFHTGTDPTRVEENRNAVHAGVSGAELLRAVERGRLWLNVTRVDRADARYRALIDQLYTDLGWLLPDFVPLASQGTLLISSPGAIVYYHADAPASVLWQLRGEKCVRVYPAQHATYLQRPHLEDIFAGVRHEYLPYQSEWDTASVAHTLRQGDWISWPQNAPHRVTNGDSVNVSLSTEHFTDDGLRRHQVYLANRFLRTRLGARELSTQEHGVAMQGKVLLRRMATRLGLNQLKYRSHQPVLRVDADAEGGVSARRDAPPEHGVL
jgi:hypothetical protein